MSHPNSLLELEYGNEYHVTLGSLKNESQKFFVTSQIHMPDQTSQKASNISIKTRSRLGKSKFVYGAKKMQESGQDDKESLDISLI